MNSETSGTPQGEAAQTVIPGAEPASVQKNTVYYSQIGFSPSVERPERLIFVCEPTAPEVPESLADLRKDYNTTARVVNNLFDTDSDTRRKFFIQLHEAADIVFLRPGLRIADGKSNLEEVRQSIVDKAQKIRDGLFWTYSQLLVLFGIIPLLIGAAIFKTNGLSYFPAPTPPAVGGAITYDPNFCWTLAIFLIPAGATICIWADFAFGMLTSMSYDKLLVLSPSRWRPIQRLLVTVVFSYILAYVLDLGVIQVGVSNRLLNDFDGKSPWLALLVGGITGLAFTTVADLIFSLRPAKRNEGG